MTLSPMIHNWPEIGKQQNMREWIRKAQAKVTNKAYFHLYMISDSTGETLITLARATAAQYSNWRAVEHITPMVRNEKELDEALSKLDRSPGIVLYTLIDPQLEQLLQEKCELAKVPALNVLAPATKIFDAYLGDTISGRTGAQHELNEDYFGRLDAIKFAMSHDDGNMPDDIEEADIILIGISRTSKTPTSIYLAQRGVKAVNIPLVPGTDLPEQVMTAKKPMVVALVASAERILQVRENRLLAFDREFAGDTYVDRASIQEELAWTKRLCKQNDWPMIDVSKRSIEETSAAILALLQNRA